MKGINRRTMLLGMGAVGAMAMGISGCNSAQAQAPAAPSAPVAGGGAAPAAPQGTRVFLLGTGGGPRVVKNGRSKPANVVIVNGTPYVVDCGEGVAQQLVNVDVTLNKLRYIFITHHHSDHNLDMGNLIYDAWAWGLRTPIDVYGPPPIQDMMKAYWEFNKFDIETRIDDEGRPDLRKMVTAHEVNKPGLVMQNAEVKVTCTRVRHVPIVHGYAYRFDTPHRSIVFSGDTAYSPELVELAKGADLLVHEAMDLQGIESIFKRVQNAATLREHLMASHTLEEDVGKVAAAAGVKKVVLTHLVPADDKSITDEMWAAGVRKHYNGPVVVGHDLMEV
ncbi:MAG TPA: MBL fold metallo-hydrolase [bacterium]